MIDKLIKMLGNEKYILKYPMAHEFIGLDVEVFSPCPSITNLNGKVIDETYATIKILCDNEIKIVPKKGNMFIFTVKGKKINVEGDKILHRPWDRLKLLLR